jgi:hypothetical protein
MKRLPRMRGSGVRLPVPPDVKTAVRDWEKKRGLQVFSQDTREDAADPNPDWQAIATLSARGCTTTDIVDVLELLWFYGKTKQYKVVRERRKNLRQEVKKLAKRLRELADETEKMEQRLGVSASLSYSNPPVLPSPARGQVPSPNTNIDSKGQSPAQSSPTTSESDSDADSSPQPQSGISEIESQEDGLALVYPEAEAQVWDKMREKAYDLDAYIRLLNDKELPFSEPFSRKFAGTAGTVVWLTTASLLIEAGTGRPHYPEIALLLKVVAPQINEEKRSEPSIEKDVTRFKKRNQEFVTECLEAGQVRRSVREWLRSLQRSQSQ